MRFLWWGKKKPEIPKAPEVKIEPKVFGCTIKDVFLNPDTVKEAVESWQALLEAVSAKEAERKQEKAKLLPLLESTQIAYRKAQTNFEEGLSNPVSSGLSEEEIRKERDTIEGLRQVREYLAARISNLDVMLEVKLPVSREHLKKLK